MMVVSEPCRGSIKQTNTFQVLVSETVPQRRVQLSRQANKTRFQENPVSSNMTIPARQPGCDTSTRNRRKFKLDVTEPDLLIPITKQTRVNERHSSDLREPQLSSSDSQPASLQPVSETTTSESSVSLPSSPSRSTSTESTSTSGTDSSSSETSSENSSQLSLSASSPVTKTSASSLHSMLPELLEMEHSFNTLLTGTREKQRYAVMRSQIGPSSVKELAKSFTPSFDEDDHSHINTRTRQKRLFEPKEKEGRSSKK